MRKASFGSCWFRPEPKLSIEHRLLALSEYRDCSVLLSCGRDESKTLRARNGLRPLLDIELSEDVLDVRFDGLGRDEKSSCDFLVGSALGDQIEDIALAGAERDNVALADAGWLRDCGSRTRFG